MSTAIATPDTEELALGLDPVDTDPADDDIRMWSVTTIIGALDKPGLLFWAAEQAAAEAVRVSGSLATRVEEDGEEAVIKWLRDARFRTPKDRLSASSLGTCTHTACEEYALTGSRPDDDRLAEIVLAEGGNNFEGVDDEVAVINTMLDRFDGWLQRFQPEYQATEVAVYNPTYGYAGTCDAFLTVDGVRFIVDYKTSREPFDSRGKPKTPYPEVALQLAAYRHAEYAAVWRPRVHTKWRRRYYLLGPAERELAVPVPEVDRGLCIHITPEACEAFPIRCDQPIFESFLFVQEAFRWTQETSKTVIAEPLEAGGEG